MWGKSKRLLLVSFLIQIFSKRFALKIHCIRLKIIMQVTMTVSKNLNAQFTNSKAWGNSVSNTQDKNSCNKNNHCVDKSVAEATETGKQIENNGQKSESSTDRDSSSSTTGGGGSVSGGYSGFGIS